MANVLHIFINSTRLFQEDVEENEQSGEFQNQEYTEQRYWSDLQQTFRTDPASSSSTSANIASPVSQAEHVDNSIANSSPVQQIR